MKLNKSKLLIGTCISCVLFYVAFTLFGLNYLPLSDLLITLDQNYQEETKNNYAPINIIPNKLIYEYILCCRKIDKNEYFINSDGSFINLLIATNLPIKQKEGLFNSFIKKGLDINAKHMLNQHDGATGLYLLVSSQTFVHDNQQANEILELLKFLLDHGARLDIKSRAKNYTTPRTLAEFFVRKKKTKLSLKILQIIKQYEVKQSGKYN